MTIKDSQIDYLNARIEALEKQNKYLTQMIAHRNKNKGFITDINDPIFSKPIDRG